MSTIIITVIATLILALPWAHCICKTKPEKWEEYDDDKPGF